MKNISEISGIKSWAEDDRPREKMVLKGRQSLSDAELLAILIGSGTQNLTAVDVAKNILKLTDQKLNELGRLEIHDLIQVQGIGQARAITILAALELGRRRRAEVPVEKPKISSSRDAYEFMSAELADKEHEEFWMIMLSRSHKVKEKVRISAGGISGTVVDQRLIFKPAIQKLASALILFHNHPSGTLHPSAQDKTLTKKLVQSSQVLDIPILDHIIYTDAGYFSFADEGLI